jgi:hypothetical protein
VISRALLVIQYSVVLYFGLAKGFTKLYLPLCLSVLTFAVAAAIFGIMTPAFKVSLGPSQSHLRDLVDRDALRSRSHHRYFIHLEGAKLQEDAHC